MKLEGKIIEKTKDIKKAILKWMIFTIAIIIFIIIANGVLKNKIFDYDIKFYNFLLKHRNPILNTIIKNITKFGNVFAVTILTLFGILIINEKKYKFMIFLNLYIVVTMNIILKNIFLRKRPNRLRLIEEKGYSFPSGHAMVSTALYGIFIYIVYKKVQNKKVRNIIITLLAILIMLIDVSRIYVGVHYTSDVIAGTCLSLAYLILFIKIVNNIK